MVVTYLFSCINSSIYRVRVADRCCGLSSRVNGSRACGACVGQHCVLSDLRVTRRIPGSVLSLSALRNAQGRGPFNSDAAALPECRSAGLPVLLRHTAPICNCRGAARLAAASGSRLAQPLRQMARLAFPVSHTINILSI